jgi:CheY-like chemotaxis protein
MAASTILLVDMANDGPAALELSRPYLYGVALLDYQMHGMDGVEWMAAVCRVDGGSGEGRLQDAHGLGVNSFQANAERGPFPLELSA